MTAVRPRKVTHRGRVEAAGFLFNAGLIGVAETRQRILDLWEPGVQVFTDGPNHYVRLSSTIRVDCRNAVATPLVQIENVLSALPLSPDEFELLHAPAHSVVFSQGGIACVTQPGSTSAESPEKWLDVTAFKVVEVTPLGAAFAQPELVAEPQPFDPRAKLDGVPEEGAGLREAIAAIKAASSGDSKPSSDRNTRDELHAWLGGLIGLFGSAFGSFWLWQSSASPGFTTQRRTDHAPLTSGWLNRLGMRLLHISQLSRVLGRRQAKYLARMMDMFERGDIDEALKHAIPLGDLSSMVQAPMLGVPSPRDSLTILPWQRSSRGIGLDSGVVAYLYQLYQASYERLIAQNRIEEAAFVLAELLRSNEQAVDLLERHGKLTLAAELAEARDLKPGLIVRQWFIAGDIKRAIRIARRTHSFADAVLRLERKKNKEEAEKLRLIWAESLAAGGNYAGAVDIIWRLDPQRLRAREWMDKAIEVGGPLSARMLARKVAIAPEDFDDIRRRALTFLEDESYEQQETRTSFAHALFLGDFTTEAQTLARVTARAILRDAGQSSTGLSARHFTRLVNFSGDGPLRTDVPPFPAEHDRPVNPSLSIECEPADRGSMPVHDALLLPNGRMLIAFGEIGARLLTPDGRMVAHFDQPAEKLVISDNGDRAIALAHRGAVWRLSRLDLISWRGEDWCDAHMEAFAPNYDGSLWFVGSKGDFYAIDTHAKNFEALWRVPDAGERVLRVARSESSCSFLTKSNQSLALEQWLYQLPLLTLRSRTSPPMQPENVLCMSRCDAISPDCTYVDQSLYYVADWDSPEPAKPTPLPSLKLHVFAREVEKFELSIGDESCRPLLPEVLGRTVVSPVVEKDGVRVRVLDLPLMNVTAQLFLASADHVSTRLTANTLTVTDNLGRVIVVDLRRNCSIRNFRI